MLIEQQQRIVDACELALMGSKNMLVAWFLITSYAYYHLNESLIPDPLYDSICKQLYDALDAFEIEHEHVTLIDTAALKAGTGFYIKQEDYPWRVRSSAEWMIDGRYP